MTTSATAGHQRSFPLTCELGIAEFVQELVAECIQELVADVRKYDGVERRAEPRFPMCIPVVVTPYDVGRQQAREKFVAVTRDISASGITFLHTACVDQDYWLLEFERPGLKKIRLVMEVLYRRSIGPFWEIAGRFVIEPMSSAANDK